MVKNFSAEWELDDRGVPYVKNIGKIAIFSKKPYKEILRYIEDPDSTLTELVDLIGEVIQEVNITLLKLK
ncbi:hypothetical protein [Paenibacillus faecalis]|uniref:hypothetical protein n=1 Tax=Paenibacillus faecalis TaxID=2079532 RepID=UPI000D106F4C|nr:hypothetical protein [Paenibacillus faecalis]